MLQKSHSQMSLDMSVRVSVSAISQAMHHVAPPFLLPSETDLARHRNLPSVGVQLCLQLQHMSMCCPELLIDLLL